MDVLTYFDQATLAILHGQGCAPEQALRLARDLVDRRGKFVEGLGYPVNPPIGHNGMLLRNPVYGPKEPMLMGHDYGEVEGLKGFQATPGTTGEGEG